TTLAALPQSQVRDHFERACLRPGEAPPFESLIRRKRLKEFRRCWRRLGELGELRFEVERSRPGSAMVEDFLDLEASGWKGEAGTAMGCRGPDASFAREMFDRTGGAGLLHVYRLRLDDRTIA